MSYFWSETFVNNTAFTALAGWASIIGTLLSIILLYVTTRVTKQINKKIRSRSDIDFFNSNYISFRQNLEAYQKLISIDQVMDFQLIKDITNIINQFENLNTILTKKDIKSIDNLRNALNQNPATMDTKTRLEISNSLSYFISRFSKEELIL